MWRLEIVNEWAFVNGQNVAYVVSAGYQGEFTDITNQPTPPITPNAVIFECIVDAATADLMEVDSNLLILSAEEIV